MGASLVPAAPLSIAIYMHDLLSGGVARLTLTLGEEFVRLGIDTTLLLHRAGGELVDQVPEGVRVVEFGTSRVIADLVPLARYLRHQRPDVLLSSLNHNNLIAIWARLVSRAPTRVVVSQHNTLSQEVATLGGWKYRILPALYRRMLPLSDRIVAVSGGVADDLVRTAGVARARIAAIYNPILHERFEELAAQPPAHPWLQTGGPRPVFISVGRLVEQKDHATLLRAFAAFRRDRPGRLVILGRGPLHDPLLALAAQLGVRDDVDFAGFRPNPLPLIRAADALVLSSRYEGFGNVLVEALGCGTPIISTDCPYGPREILEGGRYGELVPVGDVARLCAALAQVGERRWPPEVLRSRARDFSAPAIARRYLDLFAEAGAAT